MAISQLQIHQRAFRLAVGTGGDPHASPVIDNEFVFEDAFPIAFREAVTRSARENGGDHASLQRVYPLVFAVGRATLPDTVIPEFLTNSMLLTTGSEDAKNNSYQPDLQRFLYPANPQLGHYTLTGSLIYYREPDGDPDVYAGAKNLITVGVPDIPSSITADLWITPDLAERTITLLAQMVTGGAAAA